MSYYVPEYSVRCVEHLISLYDFQNYDYGDEELNKFAKTVNTDWFMSIKRKWHRAYSDFVTFEIGRTQPCTLNHYVFSKEDKEGFQLVINDRKFKYIMTDEKGYAEYLFNYVLTPEKLIIRIAPMLAKYKAYCEEGERLREKRRKEEDERDFKRNPTRWSPEKRIEEYIERLYNSKSDTRRYSDDYDVYSSHYSSMEMLSDIKKAMSKEELEEAHRMYWEIYNEDPNGPKKYE